MENCINKNEKDFCSKKMKYVKPEDCQTCKDCEKPSMNERLQTLCD